MDQIFELFLEKSATFYETIKDFSAFDILILLTNAAIFLLAAWIVRKVSPSGNREQRGKQVQNLRALNLLLFSLYFIPFFLNETAGKISKSVLVLLLSYLAVHVVNLYTRHKFGREKCIEEERILYDTYQSEMFSLLGLLAILATAFLFIINIWDITDWLKATSVVGGFLIVVYSTKDVWAPENIHALIMLYNGDLEPGCVVRVPELNLLAVVKKVTLTQTVFRDLRQGHQILLPNSRFNMAKIEILSNGPSKGLLQWVDFKIGYGIPGEKVEAFLFEIWERAVKAEPAINKSGKPHVHLIDNGDHAAVWRLFYSVKTIYKMMGATFAIQRAAYDLSLETGIDLSTPFTHQMAPSSMAPPVEPPKEKETP